MFAGLCCGSVSDCTLHVMQWEKDISSLIEPVGKIKDVLPMYVGRGDDSD